MPIGAAPGRRSPTSPAPPWSSPPRAPRSPIARFARSPARPVSPSMPSTGPNSAISTRRRSSTGRRSPSRWRARASPRCCRARCAPASRRCCRRPSAISPVSPNASATGSLPGCRRPATAAATGPTSFPAPVADKVFAGRIREAEREALAALEIDTARRRSCLARRRRSGCRGPSDPSRPARAPGSRRHRL